MNERIKELARQAGLRTEIMIDDSSRDVACYVDNHGSIPCVETIHTLAELIVRECIRVPYDMWDKAELNADIAVKIEHRIKEHFGVEE